MDGYWQLDQIYFLLTVLVVLPLAALAIAPLSASLWGPIPMLNTFSDWLYRLYRESPWRTILVAFCLSFAFLSLMNDLRWLRHAQDVSHQYLTFLAYSTLDKYFVSVGFTEVFVILAWQRAKQLRNVAGSVNVPGSD